MRRMTAWSAVCLLAVSLVAGCGGGDDVGGAGASGVVGDDTHTETSEASPAEELPVTGADQTLVLPSELLTLADAEALVGRDMAVTLNADGVEHFDLPDVFGGLRTIYEVPDSGSLYPAYLLQVAVKQDAALDPDDEQHRRLLDLGGITALAETMREGYEEDTLGAFDITWQDGLGEWAAVITSPIHTITFFSQGYLLEVALTGQDDPLTRTPDEESAWKIERLQEAAALVLTRLPAATG